MFKLHMIQQHGIRGIVYGNYMLRPKYIVGSGMESMSWSSSFDYKKMSKDFKLPCVCPVCSDVKDVYGFFNYYEMKENKETKKIEETIVFKNIILQWAFIIYIFN